MFMLRALTSALVLAVALTAVVAAAEPHQVTFKGTVGSVEGKFIRVIVINEKTKKPETITTQWDADTKFLRGDKLVSFADAKIMPKEAVTVTFDNDDDANFLVVVRLAAAK